MSCSCLPPSCRSGAFRALLLVLLPGVALAQTPPAKTLSAARATAVDEAVAAEMATQKVAGLAVGILQEGQIVYLKGYGLADREQKVPVTPKTVFNWASNSKPLAAVLAMQLVEKNCLDLDADVRQYVPDFPATTPVITTRQLLCHQSGLPHYHNGQVVATERQYQEKHPFLNPVVALDRFNRSPLLFTPGEKTSYSTYGYILLCAVIQQAGHEPFWDQLQKRVAKPLSLASLQHDFASAGQPHWAKGYIKNKQEQVVEAPEEANYWKHGGGGFKSNIGDFARWAQALLNRELVGAETEKQMWTPQPTNDGKATTWGLGFTVEKQGSLKISHNGGQPEVATRMVLYPRSRQGVVVLCNSNYAQIGAFTTAIYKALQGTESKDN